MTTSKGKTPRQPERGNIMRKTSTKTALWAIERYEEKVKHFENCIDGIRNGTAPEWIADKPVAYYEGMIYGALTACEEILHRERSYYGFSYAVKGFTSVLPFELGTNVSDAPGYADYRVFFGTR